MNWKRGLIRLWAVASIIWLLLGGCFVWIDPYGYRYLRKPTQAEISQCMAQGRHPDYCNLEILDESRRASFSFRFALVLIAPIAIFALGAPLYWAFSGFSSRPERN